MAGTILAWVARSVHGLPSFLAGGAREHWRSAVALSAALGSFVLLMGLLGSSRVINLPFMAENWDVLAGPAWFSVELTTAAFFLGFLVAVPVAALLAHGPSGLGSDSRGPTRPRSWRRRIRRGLLSLGFGGSIGYVEGFRGTPFYVQMWIVYYVSLYAFSGYRDVYVLAGLIALTINTIAYQAEVLRAGFQSVPQGQVDAAKAIGMRSGQIFRHVTLPQGLRLVILPLVNEWISLFKASAILSFITIQELTFWANDLGSNQGHPVEAFLMVAVFYLGITIPLSRALTYVERKKRIPGLGVTAPERGRRRPGAMPR